MSDPARPSSSLPLALDRSPDSLDDLTSAPAAASDPASSILAQPLDSQQLLQGRRELQILHQGQIYRLQQTRQGKLILIK